MPPGYFYPFRPFMLGLLRHLEREVGQAATTQYRTNVSDIEARARRDAGREDTIASLEVFLTGEEHGGGAVGPPPASKASMKAMRTVEFAEGAVEAAEECPICLHGLGAMVKEMPCGHRFHGGCIDKWLGMHGLCPLCRFQMPAEKEAGSRADDYYTGGDEDDHNDDLHRRRLRRLQ